jgi:hypothetical protein
MPLQEIIETLKNTDNEGTAAPYWLIIDPKQMMKPSLCAVASMVTGPFFCRKDAENFLVAKKHNFTDRAKVFCHSGSGSFKYRKLCEEAGI